jgi:hypothetical protein
MDTELLVENQIDDGWKLIAEIIRSGFDVTVAFWVRTSEEGLWFLYIASNSVDPERIGDAYRTVYACLSRIPGSKIQISEIKLISASNPIARDALSARNRYPGRLPTRYHGNRLGSIAIEEAYIYPQIAGTMTPHEVLQTITSLMSRSGLVQPALVTLSDGTTFRAIPVNVQVGTSGGIHIGFLDVDTNTSRQVGANEVIKIQ